MPAAHPISVWHWAAFIVCVLIFLALDLGVFHRRAHVVGFREALAWTTVWFIMAMLFAFIAAPHMIDTWEAEEIREFITGYITELSLSMDNVFVIALIFTYFKVPSSYQHRVLFWGILGALVMRGGMIGAGAVLIRHFHWVLYVFGGFLVITGFRMLFAEEHGVDPEKNIIIRLARRFYPVSDHFDHHHFTTLQRGRRALTPLALVLLMVETTDLVFALDSIPAIFLVTTKPFIVFTSNVFAILGLRSLYFVLAGAIEYFRYLKFGLSLVLVFIGGKMLLEIWGKKMDSTIALSIVATILVVSMFFSIMAARRDARRR